MNHWTLITDPMAPWNAPENYSIECSNCHENLEHFEMVDPIKICGEYYCDSCTSEITRLGFRCRTVNMMTKDLVKTADDDAYMKIWQNEFDKDGTVKHI